MRVTLAALFAVALLPSALFAQPPQPDLSGFRWFAALAGSCWKGEHPGGRGSDTQCYETQYGRLMRGTIRMTQQREGATVSFEGDSVFAWNAKAGLINYSQWGTSGTLASGEAMFEGDVLRFPDRPRDGEVRGRTSWVRLDEDSYRVTRERREAGEWKEAFSVTYRRVRP